MRLLLFSQLYTSNANALVVVDLFDNMYDLVDALTFRLHTISPNMWPIFELTYDLFKNDAVDFLDGMSYASAYLYSLMKMLICRNASLAGQFRIVRYRCAQGTPRLQTEGA